MIDHLAIGLLGLIAVVLIIQSQRRRDCDDRVKQAGDEAARRALDGYRTGFNQGTAEAERHYFDWIEKRK